MDQTALHVRIDAADFWFAAEHPPEPGDAVTAHVHQRTATGLVHVVKPVAMRSGMFFALAHLENFSHGSFVHQLVDPLVFRRETKFFGVHQLSVRRFAGCDHFVRFLEVHRQGLFDDDVLARLGRREHGAMMQKIWDANVHHVAARFSNGLVETAEPPGDVMLLREGFRALRFARENRHHFSVRHEAMIGFDVDIGDESRAQQGNFGFAHRK